MSGRTAMRSLRRVAELVTAGASVGVITARYQSYLAKEEAARAAAEIAEAQAARRAEQHEHAEALARAREEGRQRGLKETAERKQSSNDDTYIGSPDDSFQIENIEELFDFYSIVAYGAIIYTMYILVSLLVVYKIKTYFKESSVKLNEDYAALKDSAANITSGALISAIGL